MNEKIKQLAKQSGISFKPGTSFNANNGEYNFDDVFVDNPTVIDKFAELIIQECVKVCEDGVNCAEDWDSSVWDQACINRGLAIKSHFGV